MTRVQCQLMLAAATGRPVLRPPPPPPPSCATFLGPTPRKFVALNCGHVHYSLRRAAHLLTVHCLSRVIPPQEWTLKDMPKHAHGGRVIHCQKKTADLHIRPAWSKLFIALLATVVCRSSHYITFFSLSVVQT